MAAIASQIISLTIVYSIIYSGTDKKKTSKLRVTGLCAGNSPETATVQADTDVPSDPHQSFSDIIII